MNEQLNFYLILGFVFHLMGDYLFQNSWLANEKTKRFFPAFIHATIYSLPFLFVTTFGYWLIIYITHYFIDRYRLATYIVRLRENRWTGDNFGFSDETPKFLSLWLLFIADNTLHVIINGLCIIGSNWSL